jgi:hypothetical protein
MVARPKVIPVEPDSELGRLLAEGTETEIVLESAGRRFRVVQETDDPFANYDPDRALAAFEQASGIFAGQDVEALKAELRAQRVQPDRRRRP